MSTERKMQVTSIPIRQVEGWLWIRYLILRGMDLPSLETLETISVKLNIPIAEFFDNPRGQTKQSKRRYELLARLTVLPQDCLIARSKSQFGSLKLSPTNRDRF